MPDATRKAYVQRARTHLWLAANHLKSQFAPPRYNILLLRETFEDKGIFSPEG